MTIWNKLENSFWAYHFWWDVIFTVLKYYGSIYESCISFFCICSFHLKRCIWAAPLVFKCAYVNRIKIQMCACICDTVVIEPLKSSKEVLKTLWGFQFFLCHASLQSQKRSTSRIIDICDRHICQCMTLEI